MDLENLNISIDLKNNPDIRKVAESNNTTACSDDSRTPLDKMDTPKLTEASTGTSSDNYGTLQHIIENMKDSQKSQHSAGPPNVHRSDNCQALPPTKAQGSLPQVKFVNDVPKFDLLSGRNLNLSFEKFTEVTVLQVEDPTHIIIRPLEWEQDFEILTTQLKDSCDGHSLNLNIDNLKQIQQMVLATSGDGAWERAKVLELKSKHRIKVEYIDSGLTGFVKTSDVFSIPEKLQVVPPLCAKVTLAGIKSSPEKAKCAKARAMLSQIICQRYFVKKAKSQDNNVINVLMAADASGGGDIAKLLLDKDLVEKDSEAEDFVPVVMMDIIDPDNFYLKTCQDMEDQFNLGLMCEKYSFIRMSNCTPRLKMVLMHQHEGKFQRVMVVDVQNYNQVTVEFLDVGGRKTVPISSLGCIPKNSGLLTAPPSAKRARLAGIRPLNGATWDEEAVNNFKLILGILEDDPVPLYAKVVNGPAASIHEPWHSTAASIHEPWHSTAASIHEPWHSVMEVQLSTEPDGSVILADGMVDMGCAKKLEGDFTSSRFFLNNLKPATSPKSGERVVFADCNHGRTNVVHMQYEKDQTLLVKLQAELFNFLKAGALQSMEGRHILVGEVVVARRAFDRNVYRAVVESIPTSGEILVRFIDFGNTEWTARNDLFLLPAAAKQYKVLSHAVELADVPASEMVTPEQEQIIAQVFNRFTLFEYTKVFKGVVARVHMQSIPQAINQHPVDVNRFFAMAVRSSHQNHEVSAWNQLPQDFSRSRNFPRWDDKNLQSSKALVPKSFKSKKLSSWTCTITHIDPNDRGVFYFMMFEDLDKIEKMFEQFPAACVSCPDFEASEGARCLWRDPDSDLVYRAAVIKEHSSDVMAVKKIDFGDTVERARSADLFQMPTKMKIALDAPLLRKASLKRFNLFDDGDKQDLFDDYDEDTQNSLLECLRKEYLYDEIELKVIGDHDGDKYNVEIMLRGAASG